MNNTPRLYGDGVHDDTDALQALLDTRVGLVAPPAPKAHYLISRTLVVHSGQELRFDRWTRIVLAPRSNCLMLRNERQAGDPDRRISLVGGIWDYNNLAQAPNHAMIGARPEHPEDAGKVYNCGPQCKRMLLPADYPADPAFGRAMLRSELGNVPYHPERYCGVVMRFVGVRDLRVQGITLKDPVTYGAQFARVEDFAIDDVTFDYNKGNPSPDNMDGVHFDGYCRRGRITNLFGTCYDDLLALNADDGYRESPIMGPIEDIVVDGIFSEGCHSAARILTTGSPIRNITIRNVHGSFYRYAVGFTHFFPERKVPGLFENITLEDFHICRCPLPPEDFHFIGDMHGDKPLFWGLIWCEGSGGSIMRNLTLSRLHRVETYRTVPTIDIDPGFTLEGLSIRDCSMENHLPDSLPFMRCRGTVRDLSVDGLRLRSVPGAGPALEGLPAAPEPAAGG